MYNGLNKIVFEISFITWFGSLGLFIDFSAGTQPFREFNV